MELKIVKINQGKAYHIAHQIETAFVGTIWTTKCNSLGSNGRERITVTNREVKPENVTCKKCLKAYYGKG